MGNSKEVYVASLSKQEQKARKIRYTIHASHDDDVSILAGLEKNDPCLNCCIFGDTLLHAAIYKNFSKITAKLLELGANINILNENRCTPLGYASSSTQYNKEIMTILLAAGADPNAPVHFTSERFCPLYQAAAKGDEDMTALLLEKGADVNLAGTSLQAEIVQMVIRHQDMKRSNKTRILDLLLPHATINLPQNDTGDTLLHACINAKQAEVKARVSQYQPNFFIQNAVGDSPLDLMNAIERQAMQDDFGRKVIS